MSRDNLEKFKKNAYQAHRTNAKWSSKGLNATMNEYNWEVEVASIPDGECSREWARYPPANGKLEAPTPPLTGLPTISNITIVLD